jgi:hypothetical protein
MAYLSYHVESAGQHKRRCTPTFCWHPSIVACRVRQPRNHSGRACGICCSRSSKWADGGTIVDASHGVTWYVWGWNVNEPRPEGPEERCDWDVK